MRCNPHIPNIDDISGAPITLNLTILILNFQCEEGARDGIDIWFMRIIVRLGGVIDWVDSFTVDNTVDI